MLLRAPGTGQPLAVTGSMAMKRAGEQRAYPLWGLRRSPPQHIAGCKEAVRYLPYSPLEGRQPSPRRNTRAQHLTQFSGSPPTPNTEFRSPCSKNARRLWSLSECRHPGTPGLWGVVLGISDKVPGDLRKGELGGTIPEAQMQPTIKRQDQPG